MMPAIAMALRQTARWGLAAVVLCLLAACQQTRAGNFEAPETIAISGGPFIAGSDAVERETAYRLDEAAYGHSVTRQSGWYDRERPRGKKILPAFAITKTAITNQQYSAFLDETGHRAPDVSADTWKGYGLIHPYERTRRHAWHNGMQPSGRALHPVVLVSHSDALAYTEWLSRKTGKSWRLPSELEWEKAVRGVDGRIFPWGDDFDPAKLNSHDTGPFDTLPVGSFSQGQSPYGLLDGAGQVFEWTSSPGNPGRFLVKGGSWDDKGCGVCRAAARHARPADLKHILIGFRVVHDL